MNNIVAASHGPAHGQPRLHVVGQGIRIFAVCSDTLFRRGVAAVLDEHGGFEWAGEAISHDAALALAARVQPDVVIVDGEPAVGAGVATLQALRPMLPRARFVMLLAQLEPEDVRAAVTAGASCVLPKSAEPGEIISALKAVYRGLWAHSAAVTQALTTPRQSASQNVRLTPRERDLLVLMARGYTNGDIARQLSIAMPTVKFHVGHIMSKLGVENRTAAVLAALRHKLVDLGDNANQAGQLANAAD